MCVGGLAAPGQGVLGEEGCSAAGLCFSAKHSGFHFPEAPSKKDSAHTSFGCELTGCLCPFPLIFHPPFQGRNKSQSLNGWLNLSWTIMKGKESIKLDFLLFQVPSISSCLDVSYTGSIYRLYASIPITLQDSGATQGIRIFLFPYFPFPFLVAVQEQPEHMWIVHGCYA